MTVFFTTNAVADLPLSSDAPYMVAISSSGLIVGSRSFASEDLVGGQQSIAVWGDDTGTTELDGALIGEDINFQLVDGLSLYDISVVTVMGSSVTYTTNGAAPIASTSSTLVCEPAFCDQWYGQNPISVSGSYMSVLLELGFTSSLGIETPYLSSDDFIAPENTGANMTVGINSSSFDPYEGGQIGAFYDVNGDGSLQCVGLQPISIGFFGMALWGDIEATPTPDGLPPGAIPQFAILFEDQIIFVEEIPEFSGYTTNGIETISEVILTSEVPYVVAVNQNNLVVGSVEVFNGASSILSIWGDDVTTNEIDGALSGEVLSLYLVQGNEIYSLSSTIIYQDLGFVNISQPDNPVGYCTSAGSYGCLDPVALNYDPDANVDDGSCVFDNISNPYIEVLINSDIPENTYLEGEDIFIEYTFHPGNEDITVSYPSTGNAIIRCTIDGGAYISLFAPYAPGHPFSNSIFLDSFDFENGTHTIEFTLYSSDLGLPIWNPLVQTTVEFEIGSAGCTNQNADNYSISATIDDGSCIIFGCMQNWADNYDTQATEDNGSCYREGCTSDWADNYDSLATINNNSCTIQLNEQEYEAVLTNNLLISSLQEQIDNLSYIQSQYNVVLNAYSIMEEQLEQCQPDAYGQISLELNEGWNMIGYNLIFPSNMVEQLSEIESDINVIKDNNGNFYWPSFGFNGIGNFTPGHGYLIKMYNDRDFIFEP